MRKDNLNNLMKLNLNIISTGMGVGLRNAKSCYYGIPIKIWGYVDTDNAG